MEKMKSLFSGGKSKVYALVILQGAIGLFVGNYFIRPALVTTAIVSTTIATSSLIADSANASCANGCRSESHTGECLDKSKHNAQLDSACVLACAEIAKVTTPVLQEPMRNVPVMQLNQRLERTKHSS